MINSVLGVYHTTGVEAFYYCLLPETVLCFNEKGEDSGLSFCSCVSSYCTKNVTKFYKKQISILPIVAACLEKNVLVFSRPVFHALFSISNCKNECILPKLFILFPDIWIYHSIIHTAQGTFSNYFCYSQLPWRNKLKK